MFLCFNLLRACISRIESVLRSTSSHWHSFMAYLSGLLSREISYTLAYPPDPRFLCLVNLLVRFFWYNGSSGRKRLIDSSVSPLWGAPTLGDVKCTHGTTLLATDRYSWSLYNFLTSLAYSLSAELAQHLYTNLHSSEV